MPRRHITLQHARAHPWAMAAAAPSDLASWLASHQSLLDTRDAEDFAARHLPRSLNIPWTEDSKQRLFELPPREIPFAVLVRESQRDEAIETLRQGRWAISHVFLDNEDLWEAALCAGAVESGPSRHIMFEPCPFFAEVFALIDADLSARRGPGSVRMCDLGCGSGRDAVWASVRGWRVVAVDNLAAAVARVEAIAQRMSLPLAAVVLDVIDRAGMEQFIAEKGPFDVVVCVRFLQRECFQSIARLVAPGGYLVYQHFREGVQHSRVGRPNHPRHILQDGELDSVFCGQHGFRRILDRSDLLDDGRPVCNFLAQRPLDGSINQARELY